MSIWGSVINKKIQVNFRIHSESRKIIKNRSASLSELVGERGLKWDRFFARIGMRQASATAWKEIQQDPLSLQALRAYSRGVNAYIDGLTPTDYPVEYKLLGAKPSRWKPKRAADLLKVMSFRLAVRSYDLHLTRHLQALGRQATRELFPEFLPSELEQPIHSDLEHIADFDKAPRRPPSANEFVSQIKDFPEFFQPFATNGSNNWAVPGSQTNSGQ